MISQVSRLASSLFVRSPFISFLFKSLAFGIHILNVTNSRMLTISDYSTIKPYYLVSWWKKIWCNNGLIPETENPMSSIPIIVTEKGDVAWLCHCFPILSIRSRDWEFHDAMMSLCHMSPLYVIGRETLCLTGLNLNMEGWCIISVRTFLRITWDKSSWFMYNKGILRIQLPSTGKRKNYCLFTWEATINTKE